MLTSVRTSLVDGEVARARIQLLGGITAVLYGMIGALGAKIWVENRVDFANPVNLVPLVAGSIAGIGRVNPKFTDSLSVGGITAGSIETPDGEVSPYRLDDPSSGRE